MTICPTFVGFSQSTGPMEGDGFPVPERIERLHWEWVFLGSVVDRSFALKANSKSDLIAALHHGEGFSKRQNV